MLYRETRVSSKPPVTCYLTRGKFKEEWHVWNTSNATVVLQSGDTILPCMVTSSFESAPCHPVRVLQDLTILGMSDSTCVLEREIRFKHGSLGQSVDPESVATQFDFVEMCISKGVKCTSYLQHYMQNPQDEELQLGSQVCSLFVQTVHEMLSRKYDIMHHYPLFNRALGLYYSDKVSSEPPELKDI